MGSIFISIIIPAYNAENTIKNTLASVLDQSYKFKEIIIIDDGSTDLTPQICLKMSRECDCIKYIRQENKGVSAARNLGISVSKGDYLCFLDADDLHTSDFLDRFSQKITETNPPLFIYSGFKVLKGKNLTKETTLFTDTDVLKKYLTFELRIHTSSFLVHRDLISKNNLKFREGLNWGEDVEFISKALYYSKDEISFVNDYLSIYNNEEFSERLSNHDHLKIDDDYKSLNYLYSFFLEENYELANVVKNKRFPYLCVNKLHNIYKYEDKNLFLEKFKKYQDMLVPRDILTLRDAKYIVLKKYLSKKYERLSRNGCF